MLTSGLLKLQVRELLLMFLTESDVGQGIYRMDEM
jgi:hypothetical protein